MVEYVDGWAAYMARSRKPIRKCALCDGAIYKGMMYINRDDRRGGKRWAHHEHVDCQAAWWQVVLTNLLRSVGQLPGSVPPEEAVDPRLEGFDLVFSQQSARVGEITWKPSEEVKRRFLHTPDLALREQAKGEIELFMGLTIDVLLRAFGHQRAAMQLSNIVQQLEQVAETAHALEKK